MLYIFPQAIVIKSLRLLPSPTFSFYSRVLEREANNFEQNVQQQRNFAGDLTPDVSSKCEKHKKGGGGTRVKKATMLKVMRCAAFEHQIFIKELKLDIVAAH
jgi:hypothetical protein